MWRSWIRDPLLHFALLSLFVFVAYRYLNPLADVDTDQVIRVDEASLVAFIQYRSKQFDAQQTLAKLQAMNPTARRELIDEYVAEEALYRAAKRFGLDADDYVIRRRLVQKMDFMAEGVAAGDAEVDETQLRAFYQANLQRYFKPATITFTHVYFASHKRGLPAAQALAAATLEQLESKSVTFAQAPGYGERFAYQLNYVERPLDEVADHFGEPMAKALMAPTVATNRWVGPMTSSHGSHLVLVTDQQSGYQPTFAQVAQAVRQDYLAQRQQERRRAFAQEIINGYELRLDPRLTGITPS